MLSMLLVALGMGMCHGRVPAVRFICKILFICNMYAIRSVHIRRHEQGQFTVAKTTARRYSSDPECAGLQPQTTARRYSWNPTWRRPFGPLASTIWIFEYKIVHFPPETWSVFLLSQARFWRVL